MMLAVFQSGKVWVRETRASFFWQVIKAQM
jgi:hypothetical protein